MIIINAMGNEIEQSTKNCGVSGEGNSTVIRISFNDEWAAYSKKVVFYNAKKQNGVAVLLTSALRIDGTNKETYQFSVPPEPLEYEGEIEYVIDGVVKENEQTTARKKSIAGRLRVRYAPNSLSDETSGGVSLTQAEQLQAGIDKVESDAKNYTDAAFNACIGAVLTDVDEKIGAAKKETKADIDAVNSALEGKVDKVEGKGLSTEDYTTEEKERFAPYPDYTDLTDMIQGSIDDSETLTKEFALNRATEAETAAKNYTNQEVDMCFEASKQYADKADKIKSERQKYYGDPNVVPSDESWFTVNDTGETIIGVTATGAAQSELVFPYEINGVKITKLFGGTNENDQTSKSVLVSSTVEKIVIPGTIAKISTSAFHNCKSLKDVVISAGVKDIGRNAFYFCSGLTSITIPDSVTSIGSRAFYFCNGLTNITIPNSVVSFGFGALYECLKLTIKCEQGSYAETYAKDNSIPIMYTDVKSSTIDSKVDKVEGKGLSTEDYTTAEKTKLSELPTNAELDNRETIAKDYTDEQTNAAYAAAISTAQTYANTAEQNAKNYVDGRLDKEFELLAEVEITETGISNVTVKKDQNNQALRLKKIFVDCTLAPIDDNEEGSTTYQSGQFSVALFLDNSTAWSFWSLTNAAWKTNATTYVPLYYWIENKKPMGIMCTATSATYNAAAMGFPVNASRYYEAAEVITGISLNVGSSTLPDMPVGTKFKIWGVKE